MRKISDFYDDKYAKIALDCSGVGSKTGCGHKIQFTTTVKSRELELFSISLEGSNYRESTVLSLASVCLCTDVPPPTKKIMRVGGRLYTGYALVSSETHNLQRVFHPGGGGG